MQDELTTKEVACVLGVSLATVYRRIDTKQIRARKFGRSFVVKRADLVRYLATEARKTEQAFGRLKAS